MNTQIQKRFKRLIDIDCILRSKRGLSMKKHAQYIQCSTRTLERDLKFLKEVFPCKIEGDGSYKKYSWVKFKPLALRRQAIILRLILLSESVTDSRKDKNLARQFLLSLFGDGQVKTKESPQ